MRVLLGLDKVNRKRATTFKKEQDKVPWPTNIKMILSQYYTKLLIKANIIAVIFKVYLSC